MLQDIVVVSSDWFKCVIVYHMTGSASGQGEVNPMFWLAPQVGKIGLSCSFRITRFVSTKTFIFPLPLHSDFPGISLLIFFHLNLYSHFLSSRLFWS